MPQVSGKGVICLNKCFMTNYEALRKSIVPMSLTEARRRRGPIYEVLIHELHISCCHTTACYFQSLIEKEETLMGHEIIHYLRENRTLLLQLFDKIKEIDPLLYGNNGACRHRAFQLLFECVELLENYGVEYNWIIADIHSIFASNFLDKTNRARFPDELKVKILFKYGVHLDDRKQHFKAISVLQEALAVARGTGLLYKNTMIQSHAMIATTLVRFYLKSCNNIWQRDPQRALSFVHKCICVLAELGHNTQPELLSEVYCMELECLIESQRFDEARQKVQSYKTKYPLNDSTAGLATSQCRVYRSDAIITYQLGIRSEAIEALKTAFKIAKEYALNNEVGDLWVLAGKVLAEEHQTLNSARIAFGMAEHFFRNVSMDVKKADLLRFVIALLKSDEVMPELIEAFKCNKSCTSFRLNQWKNLCQPFWVILKPEQLQLDHQNIHSIDPIVLLSKPGGFGLTAHSGTHQHVKIPKSIYEEADADGMALVDCILEEYPRTKGEEYFQGLVQENVKQFFLRLQRQFAPEDDAD